MSALVGLTERDLYLPGKTNIGVIRRDDSALLIDSGNDKDAGRRIKRALEEEGLKCKSLFNTHSHADHIGGNRYLERNTGCTIYAPRDEIGFVLNPILEASFLYGSDPHEELRHKSVLAERCDAEVISDDILPDGVKIIDLPGHTYGMLGFLTDDGAAFLADSILSEELIEKHKIVYIYDVDAELKTLEKLKTLNAKIYLPSHAEKTDDITSLIDVNIKNINDTASMIFDTINRAKTHEEILKDVFDESALVMTPIQHVLIGSVVKAYLTYLRRKGLIISEIENNKMYYKRKA